MCKRYGVDNSNRDLHGALLDAQILADLYLIMTGGQTALLLADDQGGAASGGQGSSIRRLPEGRKAGRVICASEQELAAHQERLAALAKASGAALWSELEG